MNKWAVILPEADFVGSCRDMMLKYHPDRYSAQEFKTSSHLVSTLLTRCKEVIDSRLSN